MTDIPYTRIIAREALAHAATFLLFPLGVSKPRKKTLRRREQRTVVLVHGYFSNRSLFFPMAAYLRALGLGPVLSFNYRSELGVEAAAVELKRFLRSHVRGGSIDLVCHSLGGLVARVYLQELGGARRVNRCITIATPHRGTYNGHWLFSRVGQEVRPDSALMGRLAASRAKAASVKFTSIVGAADNIILPRDFAADGDDLIGLPETGHLGLLFSAKVYQEIAKRLLVPLT